MNPALYLLACLAILFAPLLPCAIVYFIVKRVDP